MVDYSRFNGIGDDSEEEEGTSSASHAPQPPSAVMDDLEDYFRRIDERQPQESETAPPSVARFSAEQIDSLPSCAYDPSAASYSECSVCLADFEPAERLTQLPCAARHLLHPSCAAQCLSRSVFCPLCRVDLSAIVPRHAAAPPPPLSPRQLGFTRDGGVILRYEPRPPEEMARPAYIPAHARRDASFVEIQYPDRGVARVWRVPRPHEASPRE
mmetsp:Transcript_8392/g.20766  ORF Transcript_8392/g.20766 Transcript_8392/m.20766 type:complete len:214 (+) Transcript_8392:287-928(+)